MELFYDGNEQNSKTRNKRNPSLEVASTII